MSSENPYQSPQTLEPVVVGVLSGDRRDLLDVAKFQKGILVCILIYLIAGICRAVVPPDLAVLVIIGVLCLGVAAAVFVFLLAIKIYGQGLGIVLGVLCIIPLLGLLVLLIVNGKATAVLKQNGIRVGLLGANLSALSTSDHV